MRGSFSIPARFFPWLKICPDHRLSIVLPEIQFIIHRKLKNMNKFSRTLVLLAVMITYTGLSQESWTRFRSNLEQTGYTENSGPVNFYEDWNFSLNSMSIVSSPGVADNRIYFGSLDSSIYCLDAGNGAFIWSFKTRGGVYYSSPAVVDGKIYIGSWDGLLYCLDANTGDSIWSYNTFSTVGFNSCPAVVNGKVYFGSNNTYIYCLDANDGSEVWSYKTGMGVWCSPAIVDGRLYIGSFDSKMRCLDAETGDSIWATAVAPMVYSSPAVVNGRLYFGSILGAQAYCLSCEDGSIVWTRSLNGAIFSSPAVYNGRMFIGVDQVALGGGRMFCLDAMTGDSLWSIFHDDGGAIYSSPAATDSLLYYGAMNFHAYCVKQATGEIVWDWPVNDQILSSPAIVNESMYFGTKDGHMICIKDFTTGQPEIASAAETPRIYPNPSSNMVHIDFTLKTQGMVQVEIHDIQGRLVRSLVNEEYPAGKSSIAWDACNETGRKTSPGIYFCRILNNGSTRTTKIVIE